MHARGQPCPVGGELQATERIIYIYLATALMLALSGMDGWMDGWIAAHGSVL